MSIELSGQRRLVWNWANFLKEDTRPRVIDTVTGDTLCELIGHTDYIRSGFELDGDRLLTWSNDRTIRVWSLADGRCESVLEGHTAYIEWVLRIDQKRVLSSSGDGTLRVWSLESGGEIASMSLPEGMRNASSGVVTEDRALVSGDGHYALFALSDGALLDDQQHDRFWSPIDRLDSEHFLVFNHDTATAIDARSGDCVHTLYELPYPWGHFVLQGDQDEATVLIWSHDARDSKTLTFTLWWPLSDSSVQWASIVGEEPVAFNERDGEVFVACKDYRVLKLCLETKNLVETTELRPESAGRFRSYRPEVGFNTDGASVGGLSARLVTLEEAESLRWEDAAWGLGASHCWWSPERIAFEGDQDGIVHEWNVDDDTRRTVPASDYWNEYSSAAELRIQQKLQSGDWPTLAEWFARKHGVDAASLTAALKSLVDNTPARRYFARPTADGRVLAWCPHARWIQILDAALDSRDVRMTDCSNHGELVGPHPLIAPDGQAYLWQDKAARPLIVEDRPVMLAPATRDSLIGGRWCQGDRVVVRHRTGVEVFDPESGESIEFLDGGHGLPNWGFVELANGTLVTWSRSVLRSWDAADYAPMVELVEPVDWGPGYEHVMATRDRGVLFNVGMYSSDTRIVHWDGAENLSVYAGHRDEVYRFVEGPDGRILSWEHKGIGNMLLWRLRD